MKHNGSKVLYSLIREMEKELKKSRYVHSLGVCFTASNLAMVYGADSEKAAIAGILHDCAKMYEDDELLKLCSKNNIPVTPVEKENAFLLHAKYGAHLAKVKYGVDDVEILDAIRCHTTGKKNMTVLDKVIFIADYIEPSRYKQNNLDEIRKIAFGSSNIDIPLMSILDNTIKYLEESKNDIDSTTLETYKFYQNEVNK